MVVFIKKHNPQVTLFLLKNVAWEKIQEEENDMKERITKLATLFLAAAITAVSVGPVNAFAATYSPAPTEEKAVNSSIVTATAHRAASPLPDMLGANTPSGFGMINGSAPTTLAEAEDSLALTVWGSDWNESPDPYWWNYYYNFKGGNSSKALLNPGTSGSPVMADKTLVAGYGNISVSLFTRPDVAIGVSSNNSVTDTHGYDDQINTIHSFVLGDGFYVTGDETYNPLLVPYDSTTLDTMIDTMYNAADALKDTGKGTRYGDPEDIAIDYENYIKGIKGYIKEVIGEDNYKTVAIVSGVTTADGVNTYTIDGYGSASGTSTNRYVEYTDDVTNNLTSNASATVSSAQLAAADAIIITTNTLEETIKDDATITASDAELISIDEMDNLYGVRMNSVENALGMGYILARIYDNVATDLNAKYVYEYFASKFYHIKSDKLNDLYAKVLVNNFEANDIERPYLHISDDSYNETDLEDLFSAYAEYY